MRRFWPYLRPYRRWLAAAVVLMVLAAGFSVVQPYLIKIAIDRHILTGDTHGAARIAFLFLGAVIVEYLVKSAYTYGLQVVGQKSIGALRRAVYDRILGFETAYFDRKPTGVLLSRTVSDTESLSETLASGIVSIFLDVLTILATLGMMAALSPILTLCVVTLAPLLWIAVRWFSRRLKESFSLVRQVNAEMSGYLDESLSGLSIIQLFRKQTERGDGFSTLNRAYCRATVKSNVYDASLYALMEGMSALTVGGLLAAMSVPRFGAAVSAGLLVAFIEYLQRIFTPIKEFSAKIALIQRAAVDLDRIFGILEERAVMPDGAEPIARIAHGIRFDDVSFRYREDTDLALKQVSFSIAKGETVAVVGPTGSGKTTLIRLLLRQYAHYSGGIYADDREVRTLKRRDYNRTIDLVAQDIFLFDGTIYDNIALERPGVDRARVEWAAQLVGVDRLVARYPDGYDHPISERGANLSAGEAQLIAFARAMAGDGDIVVLDEATGNIDSETEHAIEEATAHILALKTCIVIAHRLSTLKRVNRILVMKDGEIVESGTHAELLARQGDYYRLYQAQMLEGEHPSP